MENTTATQFTNDIAPLPERPQFLKVLCILTWVCCGLMFISTLSGMVLRPSAEAMQQNIDEISKVSPETAEKLEATMASESLAMRTMNSVLNLVALALSAFGAAQMWKLKKSGFYLYIAGEILPYLGFLFGGAAAMSAAASMAGGMGSAVVGIVVGIMVIADIAFIAMYAVNLKYMNK